MIAPRKKHELRNYDFCAGMGVNWVDMDTGKFYHIQEYCEKMASGEHPEKIRVSPYSDPNETLEWVDPMIVKERMQDPEPDPRY